MTTSIDETMGRLTGPGSPFEIVEEPVHGVTMPVFRNRPRSTRQLLIEAQKYADADYVVCGDQRVSFDQGFRHAAAFAGVLQERFGVRKGDRVAVFSANCPEWITTFWAATSIGAVFASMNAWWAEPEVEHAIRSAEPTVVVVDSQRRALVQRIADQLATRTPMHIVEIDNDFDALVADAGERSELPDVAIDEDDPAVILYTSGTTGRSKGAVASHRSLCGVVTLNQFSAVATAAAMGIDLTASTTVGSKQITLVTVPLFHASGLYGFVITQLAFGGTVVLRRGRFDEDDVLRLIEAEQVTMWAALGSMGPRVADRAKESTRDLSSMRTLAVGGAPVSPSLQEKLRTAFPNASLNVSMGYTSSEAVAVVTRIQGTDLRDHPTSAGGVNATTQIEVRDSNGRRYQTASTARSTCAART